MSSSLGRQLFLTICVAAAAVLVLYLDPSFEFIKSKLPQSTTATLNFDWNTRQEQFPVDKYIPIPAPGRKSLPRIQHAFKTVSQNKTSTREQRQKEIKIALTKSWKAYRKHALPQDELKSISGTGHDVYGNWASTLISSLDTLWIAGLKDEFKEAVGFVPAIDFTFTIQAESLPVYDVTSKLLGGLLSAYDLSKDRRLKDKATELATMLYAAFDTPNRLPNTQWNTLATKAGKRQQASSNATVGDVGGLALDFTKLAIITKDPKWYDTVARIMDKLSDQQESAPIPGLLPNQYDLRDGKLGDALRMDLGPESKAFYESIPKVFALLRGSEQYRIMYKHVTDAAIEHLLFQPMLPPGSQSSEILMAGSFPNTLGSQSQHAACFFPGMLAYGGRLMRSEPHIETGRRLLNGCLWASSASPLGIMPDIFTVSACPSKSPCEWDEEKYQDEVIRLYGEAHPDQTTPASNIITWKERLPQGFTSISSRHYHLSSEVIESLFVLYRITGDEDLREKAWQLWMNVFGRSKTSYGHAVLEDVTMPNPPKGDLMPSDWTAKTLKYFYLMFSEPETLSLDQWVFSTGGHPFRLGREDLD